MTQHYLAGELSVRLAQLQTVALDDESRRNVAVLRRQAETVPLAQLGAVAARALDLTDTLCWKSVAQGDIAMFDREAAMSAELFEFSVCAGLLGDQAGG